MFCFFANILGKTKTFAKAFLPVHIGPMGGFFLYIKKCQKSRDSVSLRLCCFRHQLCTYVYKVFAKYGVEGGGEGGGGG